MIMEIPELPYLKLVVAFMTICAGLMGSLVILIEPRLPTFITQTFRYGKFAYKGPTSQNTFLGIRPIELPKRWFKHFYVFAVLYTTYATGLAFAVYCGKADVPSWLEQLFDFMLTRDRKPAASSGYVLVALMLLTAQCWRRFYETFFVSVFSNARINITHYIAGYVHYFAAATAIIAEAPKFAGDKSQIAEEGLTASSVIAVGIFLWAFVHQFRSALILAGLRKNEKGTVVNTKHSIPKGDWFEWVSSPHLLAEILMYVALSVLLWQNTTWRYVLTWVICNQVETALLTHWWYKETFKDYPAQRKALIPFIL